MITPVLSRPFLRPLLAFAFLSSPLTPPSSLPLSFSFLQDSILPVLANFGSSQLPVRLLKFYCRVFSYPSTTMSYVAIIIIATALCAAPLLLVPFHLQIIIHEALM